MFRWHWVLLLVLFPASPALGYPIQVRFTVQGDPSDPVNAGVPASGDFIFDSSIVPYGGGMVWSNYPPGLEFSSLNLNWDGHLWTADNSFCNILTFAADGSLTDWSIADKGTPNGVYGGTFDFAIDVHPTSQTFSYSRPGAPGVYGGTVTSWDVTTLPTIVGAWLGSGTQLALDSFGRVYSYTAPDEGQLGNVTILGNMFNGPPPSPVVAMTLGGGTSVFATLQNGDLWLLFSGATSGTHVGNIFSAPGITAVVETPPSGANALGRSRPNPFNPATTLPYTLGVPGRVAIRIYDVSGRLVRTLEDGHRPAGAQSASWNGQDDNGRQVASGTYFGRITFPDGTSSERKLTVLK